MKSKLTNKCRTLGKKAPSCLEHLGTVLSLLDRIASCWWICRKGDHLIEYLCGRATSNARAAVRLLRFGFYDESLLLSRAIGETANLLQLFHQDANALELWKESSRRDRMREFKPAKVRQRLENLQTSPVINEERYRLLSERAAHVHPETKPQSHNILGIPAPGANLQEAGLLVCLNELAGPLSMTAFFGVLLLDLEKDIKKRVISVAITTIDDYHRQIREGEPVA